jgi:hypothetical protein
MSLARLTVGCSRSYTRSHSVAFATSEITVTLLIAVAAALAFQPPEDKSGFTLVNPVPRELMREMSTDRPDTTESPVTVDAGHFQLEMSFVEFSRENDGGRVDTWTIAPINVKAGLLNNADLQLLFDPYIHEDAAGQSGLAAVGDLTLRVKVNLIGNDSGDFAIAIMPFVKIPTGGDKVSNGALEGGLIVPLSIALPEEFSLGLMLELDAGRNDQSSYDAELVHTAVLGRGLWGELSGYVEYVGVAPLKSGADYAASVNAGLAYALTPDVQLDGGIGLGLTDAAADFSTFAGISLRF